MKRLVSLFTVLLLVFTATAGLAEEQNITLGDFIVRYNELCVNDDQDIVVTMDWIYDDGMLVEYDDKTGFTWSLHWKAPFKDVDTVIDSILIKQGSASVSVFLSRCDRVMQTVYKDMVPGQCRAAIMNAITAFQDEPQKIINGNMIAVAHEPYSYVYTEDDTGITFAVLLNMTE